MHKMYSLALGLTLVAGAACSSSHPAPAPGTGVSAEPRGTSEASVVSEAAAASPAPAPGGPGDYVALRDEVGKLASASCASCHRTSSPEAKPGALAIFDLDREDWPKTILPEHHAGFRKRLASKADDATKQRIDAFLAALPGK
jgi:hypothetical protein